MKSQRHVLYRFYNADDELLYVGITNNPASRFRVHEGSKQWWDEVDRIELKRYGSREELDAAERLAIRHEKPRYNIVCADPRQAIEARKLGATYSLAQVAAEYLPPDWRDGERWLSRRLNTGELKGIKFGRVWRMRDIDIEYMLSRYSNEERATNQTARPVPASTPEPVDIIAGLSARSRARLKIVREAGGRLPQPLADAGDSVSG